MARTKKHYKEVTPTPEKKAVTDHNADFAESLIKSARPRKEKTNPDYTANAIRNTLPTLYNLLNSGVLTAKECEQVKEDIATLNGMMCDKITARQTARQTEITARRTAVQNAVKRVEIIRETVTKRTEQQKKTTARNKARNQRMQAREMVTAAHNHQMNNNALTFGGKLLKVLSAVHNDCTTAKVPCHWYANATKRMNVNRAIKDTMTAYGYIMTSDGHVTKKTFVSDLADVAPVKQKPIGENPDSVNPYAFDYVRYDYDSDILYRIGKHAVNRLLGLKDGGKYATSHRTDTETAKPIYIDHKDRLVINDGNLTGGSAYANQYRMQYKSRQITPEKPIVRHHDTFNDFDELTQSAILGMLESYSVQYIITAFCNYGLDMADFERQNITIDDFGGNTRKYNKYKRSQVPYLAVLHEGENAVSRIVGSEQRNHTCKWLTSRDEFGNPNPIDEKTGKPKLELTERKTELVASHIDSETGKTVYVRKSIKVGSTSLESVQAYGDAYHTNLLSVFDGGRPMIYGMDYSSLTNADNIKRLYNAVKEVLSKKQLDCFRIIIKSTLKNDDYTKGMAITAVRRAMYSNKDVKTGRQQAAHMIADTMKAVRKAYASVNKGYTPKPEKPVKIIKRVACTPRKERLERERLARVEANRERLASWERFKDENKDSIVVVSR